MRSYSGKSLWRRFIVLILCWHVLLLPPLLISAVAASKPPQLPQSKALLVFSQDGNTFARVQEDGRITVLDVPSQQERATLAASVSGVVTGLALSPDGMSLARAAVDTITLWDVASGRKRATFSAPVQNVVTQLAFSPDGRSLAGLAEQSAILLWDITSGVQQRLVVGGGAAIRDVMFSADGTLLASRGNDDRLTLFDTASGQEHATLVNRTDAPFTGMVFSPATMTLAAVDGEDNITIWDAAAARSSQYLRTRQDVIEAMAFHHDGTILASAATQIKLWDVVSGQELATLSGQGDNAITMLAFSPNGQTLAGVGKDGRIFLWDVSSATLRQVFGGQQEMAAMAFSTTTQALASVGSDGQVRVWEGTAVAQSGASAQEKRRPRKLPPAKDAPAVEAAAGDCLNPANAIVAENCLTGNPSTEWNVSGAGDTSIQGFATDISVNRGQTVSFKIQTTATNYRLDIYRMGYYGGLGARKVATVLPSVTLPQNQPACLTNGSSGLIDCGNWAVSASWAVPATATSGIYFARAVRTDTNGASHIFFVVRDDASTSDILFQTADTTWQAYNDYGGNSLYTGSPVGRAYKVSYNRPFRTRAVDNGQDWVFNAEYPMVRWLESNGYNVSYFTGVDSDRRGALILNHRLFLSVGHDEYWSGTQFSNVEAARNAGVHLAFFSGNEVFWKTRWENSIDASNTPYRTLVCYKETHANAKIDPNPAWTGTWRDPRFSPPADGGRPENALTGTLFTVNAGATTSIKVPAEDGKMRFWRNTSIATLPAGSTATLPFGTLGYEWDEDIDNGFRPAGLIRLSTTTVPNAPVLQDYGSTFGSGTATHSLTLYRHNSGALVFGAGTVQWSWGLDSNHDLGSTAPDVRMQQATVNLFADMGVQPATLQTGLVAATASTDTVPPTSVIVSPVSGANIPQGSPVTISGTATDSGGVVGGVEVSVDGGVTWHPASGRSNWSYTWTFGNSGAATIKSRAIDDSGRRETPGVSITVTVGSGVPNTCNGSTIWSGNAAPVTAADPDTSAVELGVKFRADSAGFICGIRFYKSSANTGTHVGRLWTSSGQQLAQATFSNETTSGWQQVNFATPVAITANTVYVASYHAPNGRYAADAGYFTTNGVDNASLHALANGVSGGNGVYLYGAGGFPSNTFDATNYWVDVVFTTSDTTAPTVTSVSPANGATGVSAATTVSATFSEAMDATTITSSTFELRNASNVLVSATVSYDPATRTATLTPSSLLANVATYTATVKGGAADPRVKDLAGNALAANVSWSFTTATVDTTPPTVTVVSPVNGATNVSPTTAVTATFSEAMDPATITTTTFELRDASNVLVPATVSYHAATLTATLTPNNVLANVATYTATVKGGTVDPRVKDLANNALTANRVWSFTTAAQDPCTGSTIWASSTVPATPSDPDTGAVELGVKFRSDSAGVICGIRFYKGTANTGTHVGSLWSNSGQLLGQATFTNETASGWQQANFATPVAIAANTVYVASYHAPNGRYAADPGYFTTGVDNAPLHALADGVSGSNGVYVYGAGGFPTNSFQASNYWVDVVFKTGDSTPPTVTATSPANGSTGVSPTTTITATFNEAMDAASITASTFELRNASNALVLASVSYNPATATATLLPSSALANAATYTATVKGGTVDPRVKDVAGNALAAHVTWTFTTATVNVPPAPPSGLIATASASGIALAWTANAESDLAGYHVYRSANATGPFSRLNAVLLSTPAYADTSAPGALTFYRVTAVDTATNESTPSGTVSAQTSTPNRLLNSGFELDADNNTRPDNWTTNTNVTRSNAVVRSESFAMRHFATNNASYTISQTVSSLAPGTTYTLAGWVNIPSTTDAFTFRIQVRWRNASNTTLRTDTVRTYTASTNGWNQALASLVAPTGTTNAQVLLVISSLNATVYVDDFALR